MEKQRRTYPEELKRNALELVRTSGKSATAVARDLGIDPGLLNRWRREAAREGNGIMAFTGHGVPCDEEMSFRFMDAHRTRWSIGKMAKVLTVSASGYYAWKGRKPSRRTLADAALVTEIRKIQKRHRRRYGSPRIQAELANAGIRVSRKRVTRLIRYNELCCLPRRRFQITTDSRHQEPVAENILNRQFDVAEPNTIGVSDITYLPTRDGWLYLCVLIDLFDRKVVGWSMRTDMTAALVVDAFGMASMMRRPRGRLLVHSDRGVQYCSAALPMLSRSMSRKGNCWDNACAESFFKPLKREVEELDGRTSRRKVRAAVFEYIEVYYNRKRLHSRNGYKPPAMVAWSVA